MIEIMIDMNVLIIITPENTIGSSQQSIDEMNGWGTRTPYDQTKIAIENRETYAKGTRSQSTKRSPLAEEIPGEI